MKTILLTLILANGADCGLTMRNMAQPVHSEANPIARTFVTHGAPLTMGYFAASTAIDYGAIRELRKHNHKKLAWVYFAGAMAIEGYSIASSARNAR